MRKIKVLQIITRLNVGGPARILINYFESFDRGRFDVDFVTGTEEKFEGNLAKLEGKDIKLTIIKELARGISPWDLIAFFRIYKVIKEKKPDIVHTHLSKAGFFGRVAAKLLKVPLVVHTYHGHIFYGYFNPILTKIFTIIESLLANKFTDKIITLSPSLRLEIIKYLKVPPQKVVCIPPALELKRFLDHQKEGEFRKEINVNKKCKLVGMIGRFAQIKGHVYLIEAAKKILEKAKDVKFIFIGDGPLKRKVINFAKKLSIIGSCIFLGFRADLYKVYKDLDLVVLPSLNEGLPLVLIEAMVCGKSIVATKVGGIVDYVNSDCGILVEPANVNQLAQGISYLLDNPKTLDKEKIEKLIDIFDKERVAKVLERLYIESLS